MLIGIIEFDLVLVASRAVNHSILVDRRVESDGDDFTSAQGSNYQVVIL